MISRRGALLALGAVGALTACAKPPRAAAVPVPPEPLHLDPLTDLVAAAGLAWIMQLHPAALVAHQGLAPALALLLPPPRTDLLAARFFSGADVGQASEVVVAGFPATTLTLARVPVDPGRIERVFLDRATAVDGRAAEHGVIRLWGTAGGQRTQVAVLGRAAVGLERGPLGPLRAAIYFARGRLRRSPSALHGPPFAEALERLGDGPARAFCAGPFEGEWGAGLGGLLRATTCAGASLRPANGPAGADVALRAVLMGAWGDQASSAAGRLEAWLRVLAEDPLGRLAGLDRPVVPPSTRAGPDAVEIEVVLDSLTLARGVQAATVASIAEILR